MFYLKKILFVTAVSFFVQSCVGSENSQKLQKPINTDYIEQNNKTFLSADFVSGILASAKSSKRMQSECFPNYKDCFIESKLKILGLNSNKHLLAYVQEFAKTTEDNRIYFRLRIQDLKDNSYQVNELFFVEDANESEALSIFLSKNAITINQLLKSHHIQLMSRQPLFSQVNNPQDIAFSFSTKRSFIYDGAESIGESSKEHINNVLLKYKGRAVYHQNVNKQSFCEECNSKMYKADLLGELLMPDITERIFVIGFLESSIHSPSGLLLQIVSVH